MHLRELVRDLFMYLLELRQACAAGRGPELAEVAQKLEELITRMDQMAASSPALAEQYQKVRYALVAFADEVVLTSGWEHAGEWESQLLELKFYGTSVAGQKFFEELERAREAGREVLEIFYLCLALGFRGVYAQDDPQLLRLKQQLLGRVSPEAARLEAALGARPAAPAQPRLLPRRISWRRVGLVVLGLIAAVVLVDRFVVWPWLTSDVGEVAELAAERLATPPPAVQAPQPKAERTPVGLRPTGASRSSAPAPGHTKSPAPAPQPVHTHPPSLQPVVPAPSPPKPATAEAKAAGSKGEQELWRYGFVVQVGVFVGPRDSGRLARRLKALGYPALVKKRPRPRGGWWYVVVVGPYADISRAEDVRGRIGKRFGLRPIVVDAWRMKDLPEAERS